MSFRKTRPAAQALHLVRKIVDEQMDSVPAAGLRLPSVRHRTRGRARRPAEEQPEVSALDVCECRRLIRQKLEAEVRRVEGDGRLDVVDHVPDVDGVAGHG